MKVVFLIGNGFDLAHGYKTRYSDFIKWLTEDLENRSLWKEFYSYSTSSVYGIRLDKPKNKILAKAREGIRWADLEAAYFDLLFNSDRPEEINNALEQVIKAFEKYLKLQTATYVEIPAYNTLFNIFEEDQVVVNFNYTSIVDKYIKDKNEIINIHGQLDDPENPPIMGYSANREQAQILLDKADNNFLRYIKQYVYLSTNQYQNLLSKIKGSKYVVIVLGLSCGESDNLILNTLLGQDECLEIYNLFHLNGVSHMQTLMNINRIIGEEKGFKKYAPLTDTFNIPSHINQLYPTIDYEIAISILNKKLRDLENSLLPQIT